MARLRFCFGFLLGLLVRLWVRTLRVRLVGTLPATPHVLCFWHGQQMALLAARPKRLVTLVSWSADGAIQHGVMTALGLAVVRGSSSRGGAAGLRGLVSRLRGGAHAAFAVDGPRGPLRRAKPGALKAAALADVSALPAAVAARRALRLRRAWDGFEVPLPFSEVLVVVGPALARASSAEALTEGIEQCRQQALALAGAQSSPRRELACPRW